MSERKLHSKTSKSVWAKLQQEMKKYPKIIIIKTEAKAQSLGRSVEKVFISCSILVLKFVAKF